MSSKGHLVTLAVQHEVSPVRRSAFGPIVREMAKAAAECPGYVAAQVTEPETSDGTTWHVSVGFEDEASLAAWRATPEWARLSKEAEALTLGAPRVEQVNGLESWFQLPSRSGTAPPPKWKTAIVSGIGIYPLLLILPSAMAPIGQILPSWLATAIGVALMSPLITWVVMPTVTRIFRGWLYSGGP